MKIITDKILLSEIKKLAKENFGDLIKAVVDVERKIMAIAGEMHADEEELLLKSGSRQKDLWGINIYPDIGRDKWIEFDSMINLRPSQNNRTRGVDDLEIRKRIIEITNSLIET